MSNDDGPALGAAERPAAGADQAMTGRALELSVVDLDMGYNRESVLRQVSFTAPAGETTVIMGPSGVGKSTLVKALLGLREPEQGEVFIGGRSVTNAPPAELAAIRRDIGVLLGGMTVHDGSVFASMSAWDNVRYPLQAHGFNAAEVDERAWRRLVEFGLAEHAHQLPHTMSGGQRRRLALARAFVEDPAMLILDDPGTALDLANRQLIVASIRAAQARTDATVLMTCHDIDMAKELGDHLVILLDGRVVADGQASELLDGIYESDDFDARFQFRAAFAADTGNSLSLAKADSDFRTLLERLGVSAVIGLALISLAGIILVAVLTAYYVN